LNETDASAVEMLTRIRAALGRDAGAAPDELPPFTIQPAAIEAEDLVNQFCVELEKVGGHVARLRSRDEVKNYLLSLLPADRHISVGISDGAALSVLGVREWLVEAGVGVVATLKEFASLREAEAGAKPAASAEGGASASLMEQYKRALIEASIGITCADYALADTGTLVLVSGDEQHRMISMLPPVHVCLLSPEHILESLTQLLARLRGDFQPRAMSAQAMTCITGPSRTADIEQTITLGVHGPRSLHVLLYSPATGG
jgi:L-lactate dehydrogenase complex protein LldG